VNARCSAGIRQKLAVIAMSDIDLLRQLMADLGPAMDAVATVVESADGANWAIEMEDELVVQVELDAQLARLALTTVLPSPSPEHRARTCEALLTFNLLWQDASAVRMALDEPGGKIIQVAEWAVATPSLQGLQETLAEFVRKATLWRTAIEAGCGQEPCAKVFEHFGANMLRV